jgi:diadenosine tetraphosphate (Ap4A) HIT family hydrolase
MADNCPFCEPEADRVWLATDLAIVLWDAFPVTEGHTLVVPRRHVASVFELSAEEQGSLWTLVANARKRLSDDLAPHGFNIGLNDGEAAGQTILHAHIHDDRG